MLASVQSSSQKHLTIHGVDVLSVGRAGSHALLFITEAVVISSFSIEDEWIALIVGGVVIYLIVKVGART